MKTTIEDFIKRHSLTKRDASPEHHWIPAMLIPPDHDDTFEVYANDDGTHAVSINTTRNKFKIVHGDLLYLESDWKDARNSYETDARPFWKENH